jgi:hypothetical protein
MGGLECRFDVIREQPFSHLRCIPKRRKAKTLATWTW